MKTLRVVDREVLILSEMARNILSHQISLIGQLLKHVGNKRKEISKEILGIPTIAIGIPTVVDAASIVSDTIKYLYDHFAYQTANINNPATKLTANVNYLKLSQKFKINKEEKEKILGMVGTLSEEETKQLIYEILNPIGYNLMVTPKEEDFVVEKLAEVISTGLNKALHKQVKQSN